MANKEVVNGVRFSGSILEKVVDEEIEKLIIPAKIKKFDLHTDLKRCLNLKEIIFEGTTNAFSKLINLYEEFWPNVLVTSVQCKNGTVEKPDLVIKDGILFAFNKKLKSIVIPHEVIEIRYDTFPPILPPSETVTEVSFEGTVNEFNNIQRLQDLWENIPDISVKCSDGIVNKPELIIEYSYPNNNLITIPKNGTVISCPYHNIDSITIPKEVKAFSRRAFRVCKSIQSISYESTISDFNKIQNLADFWKEVPTSCVKCSDGVIEKPVLLIQDNVLIKCIDKKVKSITIPDSVTNLNRDAFHDCTLLEEVIFPPKLRTIETDCFRGCTSLKKLELPEGLVEIDPNIISRCYNLSSLTLPSTLRTIKGTLGFRGNYSLKEFIFRGTIEELVEIDARNLWQFENFRGVQCSDGFFPRPDYLLLDSGVFGNNRMAESITIQEGLEVIGRRAFSTYKKLKHISLPYTLKIIDPYAFSQCYSLENIELPVSLETIGFCAFQDCRRLTKIHIPNSIEAIGDNAFGGCINLSEIIYDGTKEQWEKITLGTRIARWTLASVIKCADGEIPLDPPYVIHGPEKDFTCNYAYKQFRIPDEAITIGNQAFFECTSLQSLTIPDSIEHIYFAFNDACSLSEIIFEGTVEKWNKLIDSPLILQYCPVKQIKCSDGIVNRELYKIEDKVLTECYNLGAPVLEIPEGVETIATDAIFSSMYIQKIIISEGVKVIEKSPFGHLPFLETVVIPSTIEKIDYLSFSLSVYLKEFLFNGTKEQWDKIKIQYEDDKYMMESKMTFLKS